MVGLFRRLLGHACAGQQRASPPDYHGRGRKTTSSLRRRAHPYASQLPLDIKGLPKRSGARVRPPVHANASPPLITNPQPGGEGAPAAPPVETPLAPPKKKANRASNARNALAKDRKAQDKLISAASAIEILEAYTNPEHIDKAFAEPLDEYDIHMANELAKMTDLAPWYETLHQEDLKVQRAKYSSRTRALNQYAAEYLEQMKREIGPETEAGQAMAMEAAPPEERRRLKRERRELTRLRKQEERRQEAERLAKLARLNAIHKQHIEEARRKQEEERRRREEKERRAEAARKAREERLEEQARRKAESLRRAEERRANEERARQVVEAFELYDAKWEALKCAEALTGIPGDLMPWPVFHAVYSPEHITYEAVKEFILHPLRASARGMSSRKKVITELLRWHSDKFGKVALLKVRSDHQEAAKECAGVVERWLTTLLTEVQA
ncbi:hypothetical protein EVJ58_g7814 [Rhodofomes roseus]|uniref:Uncharacterized protein n=1 Tax=Rhodofomes roseus TaxID=34475 RepID=A0A4Y9Y3Z8_9APHY|nr:hypothetical protein EVJ58_g7814 [Rhodofomes roseus]